MNHESPSPDDQWPSTNDPYDRPPPAPAPPRRLWWLGAGLVVAAVLATLGGLTALAVLVVANAVIGEFGSNK